MNEGMMPQMPQMPKKKDMGDGSEENPKIEEEVVDFNKLYQNQVRANERRR